MEDETRMARQPGLDLRMLVGGVVVDDSLDDPAGWHRPLDGIEKADEFLMSMTLHAASDDLAFKDVESGEQGGGAMALVVMGKTVSIAKAHR